MTNTESKATETMTIAEIRDYCVQEGVNVSAFWDHAMGGDMQPLPRRDVRRLAREVRDARDDYEDECAELSRA